MVADSRIKIRSSPVWSDFNCNSNELRWVLTRCSIAVTIVVGQGPRRVTQQEIRDAFRDGWQVVEIREARFQATDHPEAKTFSPGGPRAWLATITRTSASR